MEYLLSQSEVTLSTQCLVSGVDEDIGSNIEFEMGENSEDEGVLDIDYFALPGRVEASFEVNTFTYSFTSRSVM